MNKKNLELKNESLLFTDCPISLTAGVDEAGRGAWVAEVFAAAVILPEHYFLPDLTDSKKLSPKKREFLFSEIKKQALDFSIAFATEKEIDELNIHQATLLAMKRAIFGLKKIKAQKVLIDGKFIPAGLGISASAVVAGDNKIPAISAASILAKVSRDMRLLKLDEKYPQYGFAKHKGYGTKAHLEAIRKYGVLDEHRKSYKPIAEFLK